MTRELSPTDPTRRFSNRVEYYVRSRPKYPRALLEFCRDKLGLLPTHKIADIGAGTGILTELFISNGNEVSAVEPNTEMRTAAESALAINPNFHSISATAESTTLPDASVEYVVAGQAFHWFDRARARREFARILAPSGWVLLIWNERRVEAGGFAADYEKIIREFETDLKYVSHQSLTSTDSAAMKEFFAPAACLTASFDNAQSLDLKGLRARAMSSSYLPLPGHPRCEEMLNRLATLYDEHQINGKVWQAYDTKVYYGRLD
jgi:SAM-dependent methyltransferase